jgi:cellulose synthase/poly-beta-1,6-N-acetylglucosamine synthase-like glycosyltransferase
MNFPFSAFIPDNRLRAPPASAVPRPGLNAEEALLAQAGMPPSVLIRIRKLASRWGVPVAEAALAVGAVRPQSYLRAVARSCGLAPEQVQTRANLRIFGMTPEPHRLLESGSLVPLESPRGAYAANVEAVPPGVLRQLVSSLGTGRLRLISRATLSASIAAGYREVLTARASDGLWQRNPRLSAATGLIRWQIVALTLLAGLFLGAVLFTPRETLLVYSAGLSLIFTVTILIRLAAAAHVLFRRLSGHRTRYRRIRDAELPRYTVLVAMFKETRVLPELVTGLRALDYPAAKLDIKLVLEEVDRETIAAARALKLPPHFEIVIVPDGAPRTKPRALNYALQFACGEHVVIYDAEDRPDPHQLRKAAAHFRDAPPEVVCLQGKLTFDNPSENWLAKQFAIEYASLFGGILPMLDKARLPIPLGGTSNHFRASVLRKLGAWDAHNVTEDADLGMRIYRAGLRAQVLESVTYEEAACQPGNWLRQRTRWLKGWMQTYCVHMRQPGRLLRELGWRGFLVFQGHFAGIVIAALVHPWSYVLIGHELTAGQLLTSPGALLDRPILMIALVNLAVGYAASMLLGYFVLQDRRLRVLAPQILLIPLYWLFISAAAYRALHQLVVAPHYWEKTEHGVTRVNRRARSA